jgi:hypothetical protein
VRIQVLVVLLDNGRYGAVCQTGDCDWSSVHAVKSAAGDAARIHRRGHRTPAPAPPVRTVPRLADHRAPLPASVLARCADTTATPCALVGEPVWLRCACGAWQTGIAGDSLAKVRQEAEELGWERAHGDGPWQCPSCALAADEARGAAA